MIKSFASLVRYTNKSHEGSIWVLATVDNEEAVFEHQPLFDSIQKVQVPLDELKLWRPTKASLPNVCDLDVATKAMPKLAPLIQD